MGDEGRWTSRPALAMLVRVVAVSVPIAASVISALVLSRVWRRPGGLVAGVGWWATIAAVSTLAAAVVQRLARRLLPLAMLLKLSLVFPDRAPSRFSMAVRAGTVRNLRVMAESARRDGVESPAAAGEQALTLLSALNVHDRRTRGHCERVRAFNDLLAEELHLPGEDRDRLRWAALLHDVGKLHVPARVLNKPGRPTNDEWARLREHPIEGAKLTAPLKEWLGPWAEVIVEHHERWDGGGYPYGLRGEQISRGGRIVAVADAYEVMTAVRPYARTVSAEAARRELASCAGTQFDPAVVRAFLNISIGKLREVIGPLSWLAQLPFLGAVPNVEAVAGAAGRVAVAAAGVGVFAVGATPQRGAAEPSASQLTVTTAVVSPPAEAATPDIPPTPRPGAGSSPEAPPVAGPAPSASESQKSPQQMLQDMIDDLTAHPTGSGSSLVDKLRATQNASTTADACSLLRDFDREVRAQSDRQIPGPRADDLLAASAAVARRFPC